MTFEEVVAEWLRGKGYAVESVESVEGDGTDYDGDTENGFRPAFSTSIWWRGTGGLSCYYNAEGEDMVSLWKFVVGAWPASLAGDEVDHDPTVV